MAEPKTTFTDQQQNILWSNVLHLILLHKVTIFQVSHKLIGSSYYSPACPTLIGRNRGHTGGHGKVWTDCRTHFNRVNVKLVTLIKLNYAVAITDFILWVMTNKTFGFVYIVPDVYVWVQISDWSRLSCCWSWLMSCNEAIALWHSLSCAQILLLI